MSNKVKSIPASVIRSIDDFDPSFSMPVTILRRGSKEIVVTLECSALSKTEWAEIRDKANDEAQARSKERIEASTSEDGVKVKITKVVLDTMEAEAELVMTFATGWDFDEELNSANLMKLENKCGGSLGAMINKYEIAIYQGRLGN